MFSVYIHIYLPLVETVSLAISNNLRCVEYLDLAKTIGTHVT